MLPSIQVIIRE